MDEPLEHRRETAETWNLSIQVNGKKLKKFFNGISNQYNNRETYQNAEKNRWTLLFSS